MSDLPEKNDGEEIATKVLINAEDCTRAMEFWTHFDIPMPDYLRVAFQKFKENETFENQQDLRLKVAEAIGYTEHAAFHDEMFVEIVQECKDVRYDMQFDKCLEEHLEVEGAAPAATPEKKDPTPTK